MSNIQPDDRGGWGGLFAKGLQGGWHLLTQLLSGYGATRESEPNVQWLRIDLGAIPQDLTGQIVGKELYPTSIGTFSDVWKCVYPFGRHHKLVLSVAVKSIRGHSDDDFRQEKSKILHEQVERWKTLVHKNVLPVYGTTLDFGTLPSLVCPWVDGGSLTHYLGVNPNLSTEKRHDMLSQISDGLSYLHSKEIMHGELNGVGSSFIIPVRILILFQANVLMDTNGNAYLTDFGLFPIVLEFRSAPYLSTAIGSSVRWAAPELFQVSDTDDGTTFQLSLRSDIYSFGSVMLQILSGNIPYHTIKRDDQVLYAIARGIKPPRAQTSFMTDQHWEFIQQCWTSVQENKRPSAADVSAFLATHRPQ
ncbi:kinase-like protein [Gyrodon lividus]|nr:kinase-like protein [Gyrodon lividus]